MMVHLPNLSPVHGRFSEHARRDSLVFLVGLVLLVTTVCLPSPVSASFGICRLQTGIGTTITCLEEEVLVAAGASCSVAWDDTIWCLRDFHPLSVNSFYARCSEIAPRKWFGDAIRDPETIQAICCRKNQAVPASFDTRQTGWSPSNCQTYSWDADQSNTGINTIECPAERPTLLVAGAHCTEGAPGNEQDIMNLNHIKYDQQNSRTKVEVRCRQFNGDAKPALKLWATCCSEQISPSPYTPPQVIGGRTGTAGTYTTTCSTDNDLLMGTSITCDNSGLIHSIVVSQGDDGSYRMAPRCFPKHGDGWSWRDATTSATCHSQRIIPRFDAFQWCSIYPSEASCTFSTIMTRSSPTQMAPSPIMLTHTQVFQQYQRLRFRLTGIDTATNVVVVLSSEWELSQYSGAQGIIGVSCGPGEFCYDIAIPPSSTSMYGKDLTVEVRLSWRFNSPMYIADVGAEVYTTTVRLELSSDTRVAALSVSPGVLTNPIFTPPVDLAGAQFHYSLNYTRVHDYPSFEIEYTLADRFATYTLSYFPSLDTLPLRPDNGVIDEAHELSLPTAVVVNHQASPQTFVQGQMPAPFSADGFSFGRSRLRFRVTAEAGGTPAVYDIEVNKPRNHDSSIASLLSTLGRLTPVFSPQVTAYQLQMRLSNPTTQVRIMFTLKDRDFAVAEAMIVDTAAATGDGLAGLGIKLPVRSSQRSCSYQSMLQFVPIYGRSTLSLKVTADDGSVTRTRIVIDKVSFRLLNLTTTIGQLTPAFTPTHVSYRLYLPNAADATVLQAHRADAYATVTWRLQSALSRRGAQKIDGVSSHVTASDDVDYIESAHLSGLPIGPGSVTVTVRASDGAAVSYTVLLDRVIDDSLALENFQLGGASSSASAPVLTPGFSSQRTNYTLSVEPGITSTMLQFDFTKLGVEVQSYWRSVRLRPMITFGQTLFKFTITGITVTPYLFQLRLLEKSTNSMLMQYNIQVFQAQSTNAYLDAILTSDGDLTPTFDYLHYDYVLRVAWPKADSRLDTNGIISGIEPLLVHLQLQSATSNMTAELTTVNGTRSTVPLFRPYTALPLLFGLLLPASSLAVGNSTLRVIVKPAAVFGVVSEYRIHIERTIRPDPVFVPDWWAHVIQTTITLSIDIGAIPDLEVARQQLAADLAYALNAAMNRFRVLDIRSGSVKATMLLLPVADSWQSKPSQLHATLLREYRMFPGSRLSQGNLTSMVDSAAEPPLVTGCLNMDREFLQKIQGDTVGCVAENDAHPTPIDEHESQPDHHSALILGSLAGLVLLVALAVVAHRLRRRQQASPTVRLTGTLKRHMTVAMAAGVASPNRSPKMKLSARSRLSSGVSTGILCFCFTLLFAISVNADCSSQIGNRFSADNPLRQRQGCMECRASKHCRWCVRSETPEGLLNDENGECLNADAYDNACLNFGKEAPQEKLIGKDDTVLRQATCSTFKLKDQKCSPQSDCEHCRAAAKGCMWCPTPISIGSTPIAHCMTAAKAKLLCAEAANQEQLRKFDDAESDPRIRVQQCDSFPTVLQQRLSLRASQKNEPLSVDDEEAIREGRDLSSEEEDIKGELLSEFTKRSKSGGTSRSLRSFMTGTMYFVVDPNQAARAALDTALKQLEATINDKMLGATKLRQQLQRFPNWYILEVGITKDFVGLPRLGATCDVKPTLCRRIFLEGDKVKFDPALNAQNPGNSCSNFPTDKTKPFPIVMNRSPTGAYATCMLYSKKDTLPSFTEKGLTWNGAAPFIGKPFPEEEPAGPDLYSHSGWKNEFYVQTAMAFLSAIKNEKNVQATFDKYWESRTFAMDYAYMKDPSPKPAAKDAALAPASSSAAPEKKHLYSYRTLNKETLELWKAPKEKRTPDQDVVMKGGANAVANGLVKQLSVGTSKYFPDEIDYFAPRYDLRTKANDVFGEAPPKSADEKDKDREFYVSPVTFEWLHLIAHSMGGPKLFLKPDNTPNDGNGKDQAPDEKDHASKTNKRVKADSNPQLARNLVLGTYAANSHMIQWENYVKSWVDKHPTDSLTLTVKTTQMLQDQPNWPTWFTSEIEYTVTAVGPGPAVPMTFMPFSQYTPSALESKFDDMILDATLKKPDGFASSSSPGQQGPSDSLGQRRLLQTQPAPKLNAQVSVGVGVLIPVLRTTPLGEWFLDRANITEPIIYWPDDNREVPALRISAEIDLERYYPFNQIRLSGNVNVEVEAFPWYGIQVDFSRPTAITQVAFVIDYESNVQLVPGIEMKNVWIRVLHSMFPFTGAVALTMLTVGGRFDLDLPGQAEPVPLSCDATMTIGQPGWSFHGLLTSYENAFGISGLTLSSLEVFARFGIVDEFELFANFELPGRTVRLGGYKTSSFIGVGVTVENVTLADLTGIFQRAFGGSVATWTEEIIFRDAFLGLANAPGSILGVPVVRGISLVATVDILAFKEIEVTVNIGSAGFYFLAKIPKIPDQYLPGSLSIGNITLMLNVPKQTPEKKAATSLSLQMGITHESIALKGAMYFETNPSKVMAIGSAGPFALSAAIPGLPDFLDLTVSELTIGYLSDGRIPQMEGLVTDFPILTSITPSTKDKSSAILIACAITNIGLLETVFGIDPTKVSMILTALLSKKTVITVKINAPELKVGSLHGGDLSLSVTKDGAQLLVTFALHLFIDLPGPPSDLATLTVTVGYDLAKQLLRFSGALGPKDIYSEDPVWPNAFGISGFDFYYIAIGIEIFIPNPLLPGVAFEGKVGFRSKGSEKKYIIGGGFAVGLKPTDMMVSVSGTNLNQCFFFVALQTLIPFAFLPGSTSDDICAALSWLTIDYLDLYVSEGAVIGEKTYPPGARLNMSASLFGKWQLAEVVGEVSLEEGNQMAKLNATIRGFKLGPLEVRGLRGPDLTFGFQISAEQQSGFFDGQIRLFSDKFLLGVYVCVGGGSFDFEFTLKIEEFNVYISAHADIPIPVLPPLNPQTAVEALIDPEGTAQQVGQSIKNIFDPSKAHFSLSASIDFEGLKKLMIKILGKCIPYIEDTVGFAVDTIEDIYEGFETGLEAAAEGFVDAQKGVSGRRVLTAIDFSEKLAVDSAKLIKDADEAVALAKAGVDDAIDESKKIVEGATQAATEAVADAEDALGTVVDTTGKVVDLASKAVTAAKDAVVDFANKIASGFFGSIMDLLENKHTRPHLMVYQRIIADEQILHYAQSLSPTQTRVMNSSRRLLFFDGVFTTVYNGIEGALDFIQGQLDKAVDFATSALDKAESVAKSEVAKATAIADTAKNAVGTTISTAKQVGASVVSTARTVLSTVEATSKTVVASAESAAATAVATSTALANTASSTLVNAAETVEDGVQQGVDLATDGIKILLKWLPIIKKGLTNFISFSGTGFKTGWNELAKDGRVSFTLAGALFDGEFEFSETLSFSIDPDDVKQGLEFIVAEMMWGTFPGLRICQAVEIISSL